MVTVLPEGCNDAVLNARVTGFEVALAWRSAAWIVKLTADIRLADVITPDDVPTET